MGRDPVCLSSSHVAFGSILMEPVYMILGQSAGTAAAIEGKLAIQDVDYPNLAAHLRGLRRILNSTD